MDDIIYRNDAINALRQCGKHCIDIMDSYHIDIEDAEYRMMRIPAVDAVPVIRCRDCKYSYIFEPWEGKDAVRYCNQLRHAYAKDSDLPVREEGFCSMGERREEDGTIS